MATDPQAAPPSSAPGPRRTLGADSAYYHWWITAVLMLGLTFGLVAVAICLFRYASIDPLTSVGVITFWLTARGFARGFTIAPLSAASLAALPEAQLRMGSGLLSLNRGIASACSVALAATVFQNRLAQRAQTLNKLPRSKLRGIKRKKHCLGAKQASGNRTLQGIEDQSLLPSAGEEFMESLHLTFELLGDFGQTASLKALAMLQNLVSMEAALHSYHDTFIIIGWISVAGILPALWMGKRAAPQADSSSPGSSEPQHCKTVDTEPTASVAVANDAPTSGAPHPPAPGTLGRFSRRILRRL